jgi:hypothetical protein
MGLGTLPPPLAGGGLQGMRQCPINRGSTCLGGTMFEKVRNFFGPNNAHRNSLIALIVSGITALATALTVAAYLQLDRALPLKLPVFAFPMRQKMELRER